MVNGTKVRYGSDRTQEAMINWMEKRMTSSTKDISSQEEVEALKKGKEVHLILYSNNTDVVGEFKIKATEDDYNSNIWHYSEYLVATGDLLQKHGKETVEIHRSFGEVLTHDGIHERFNWWIGKYSRPLVLPFDDRTVKEVFSRSQNIVVFFNPEGLEKPIRVANEVAKDYFGEILIS